ncbi:MAG TPA: ABC transporter permease [Candidatus Dormibacteraeota bacterium]|nr:ABC transporter permease [Candidatus Dormibacteraeota bacterium]
MTGSKAIEEGAAGAAGRAWLRYGVVALVLIVALALVAHFTHGAFLDPGNLVNVLRQITYNAILAAGQTFVIITAGIDLSVGSLVSLCGVVMALAANALPFHGAALVAATLVIGAAVGGLAGFINALPVVRLGLPPFITTLAMMLMARGLAYKLAHGRPIPVNSDAFNAIGIGFTLKGLGRALQMPGIPVAVIWMAVVLIVCGVLLARTRFGRYVYAIGGNAEAARLAGIPNRVVITAVYVISGVCAAIASLLLMARFQSGSPQTGYGFELTVIAAVVVGGTSLFGGSGTIAGTFVGALLIGVLNNVMNLANVESYTQDIALGAVILLALILDQVRKRIWS